MRRFTRALRFASSARTSRRDDRAEKLDRAQDRVLRLGADRHLHEVAVVVKNLVLSEDFRDRFVGRSDHQMSARPAALIELRARQGRPAAFAADAAHHLCVRREKCLDRRFRAVSEKAVAVDPDEKLVGRHAGAAA